MWCGVLLVATALDAAGCEKIAMKSGDKPVGVVWHVFRPQDADRIRSFVDKVVVIVVVVVVVVVVEWCRKSGPSCSL